MSGRYGVKFLGNTSTDGHTTYTIKVLSPEGESWTICKRYREINELHEELRLRHESLPRMPAKRLWGNQDPSFIALRQQQLQDYLEGVLRIDPHLNTPALKAFLGNPTPQGERNQQRQYQQILDKMQGKLLNLSMPPATLDDSEISQRMTKYGHAMRLHVLSQPVDPIHLALPAFNMQPAEFAACSSEQLEQLKAPVGTQDTALLSDMLDGLQQVLHTEQLGADPKKLIVDFPSISSS